MMASICYEVFGQVLIEGFARRTPAISFDFAGPAEVVRESGGGLATRRTRSWSKCST